MLDRHLYADARNAPARAKDAQPLNTWAALATPVKLDLLLKRCFRLSCVLAIFGMGIPGLIVTRRMYRRRRAGQDLIDLDKIQPWGARHTCAWLRRCPDLIGMRFRFVDEGMCGVNFRVNSLLNDFEQ